MGGWLEEWGQQVDGVLVHRPVALVLELTAEAARHAGVGGELGALAVAAGEVAAGERAPRDHAHSVALARGQHRPLDLAHEDRIRRLLAPEPLAAAPLGDPLRL